MSIALQTVPEFIHERSHGFATLPAFTCLGCSLSFAEVESFSDAFASWLIHESGLQQGDRVAIQMPNLLQYPIVALGVFKAGMVLVNINPLYTPSELRFQLKDSGAKLLVVLANMAHKAASILDDTDVERVIVTQVGDMLPLPKRYLINFLVKVIKKMVPAYSFKQQCTFLSVLSKGKSLRKKNGSLDVVTKPSDIALLQYTGGTTGVSKGAMLSHQNLVSNLLQVIEQFGDELPAAGSVVVCPLPLYHIYAFNLSLVHGMAHGHDTLLIPNPKDMGAFVKALKPHQITGFVGINTLFRILCDDERFCELDFSKLSLVSAGGMALSPVVAQRWEDVTGCEITEGYGMSECSPLLLCNTKKDRKLGSVGRLLAGTQLQIVDSENRPVACGESGEICVKGPQLMTGYWNCTEENAKVFDKDGWFHTGDVGVLDEQGYLRIVDRLKDMIIISGFNVYPNEVEEFVCNHPDIEDACAIGVGDRYAMQIKLFIVARNPDVNEQEIIAWCREGLAGYKVPRQIEFRSSLPKSNVGKVLRKILREETELLNKSND